MRKLAAAVLALLLGASLFAVIRGGDTATRQRREIASTGPSWQQPLGVDELGRDRLARLEYATAVSLLLAAGSAAIAIAIAALAGGIAGYFGGWRDRCLKPAIDLMLSLPWFFLLIAARTVLPLNASPLTSLIVTYALLALLGWAGPARVVRAGVRDLRTSEFVLRARAEGSSEWRIVLRQILPNLKPVLSGQFWTAIPALILAEANLGFLGLSAAEPFPTWGGLLRELQNPLLAPAAAFAPVIAIVASLCCFKSISGWKGSQI